MLPIMIVTKSYHTANSLTIIYINTDKLVSNPNKPSKLLAMVQLNLNLTLACKSLKKFCKIIARSLQAMYARMTLCAVYHMNNSIRI